MAVAVVVAIAVAVGAEAACSLQFHVSAILVFSLNVDLHLVLVS